MPISSDFPFPRRYNSLRLMGFDYTSRSVLYFITMNTDASRPVFGDLQLAKITIGSLLDPRTTARMRVHAYSLLPDHLHLLASVRELGKSISALLGAFKSYTTQQYWKRGREAVERQSISSPPRSVQKSAREEARIILQPLMEWRATIRPESIELKNWPNVRPEHFLSKRLWHGSFNDHIVRNSDDLRETVEYIALNPVKRGYVSNAQFYPFTGFCLLDDSDRAGAAGDEALT